MENIELTPEPDVFRGLGEACAYLSELGYDCHPATLSRGVKAGKIGASREKGELVFAKKALDAYVRHLRPRDGGEGDDKRTRTYLRQKAELELRELGIETERKALRLAAEQGKLLPRDRVEEEWGAAAQLLVSSFETWSHEASDAILELVKGDAERQPELLRYLLESTEDYFDQFAAEREWTVEMGEE